MWECLFWSWYLSVSVLVQNLQKSKPTFVGFPKQRIGSQPDKQARQLNIFPGGVQFAFPLASAHERRFRFILPCGQAQHCRQTSFRFPCGQPVHCVQPRLTLPCGQDVHSKQLRLILPCGHALHCRQYAICLPCGHARHCRHLFLALPCGHAAQLAGFPQFAMWTATAFSAASSRFAMGT